MCAAFFTLSLIVYRSNGRHQKLRRSAIQHVAALLLAALMAACATPAPEATPGPGATPAPVEAAGPVTLLLWHGWFGAERQALSQLVERFNRTHPEGRVVLQSVPIATFAADLRGAAAAGSGPHLALFPNTWIGSLAADSVLLPLDDLIPAAERETLIPTTVAGALAPDAGGASRLYGLPVRFDTLALYYNTANVLSPPPDTIALIESARGLGAPNATPPIWGLAMNLSLDTTIGYLYAFGGRVFDEQGEPVLGTSGRAGAEQWLDWLAALNSDKQILARFESSILVDRELKSGRALMTFDWAHQIVIYRNLWGNQLGVAPLPRLSANDQPPRPYVRSDVLAINGRVGARERDVALAFLGFMISPEAQQTLLEYDIQPALRALPLDDGSQRAAVAQVFRAQAEQGLPMPNSVDRALVEQELRFMQQQVLMGFTSPADAVTEADRRLRDRLGLPEPSPVAAP